MSGFYVSSLIGQPQAKRDAIIHTLLPFQGWEPTLKPVISNLETKAEEAIFWCKFKGVCTFHPSESSQLWSSIYESLQSVLEHPFGHELQKSLRNRFLTPLNESSWSSFNDSLRTLIEESFSSSIGHSVDHILADKLEIATKLKPLLELWLAGNFPIGIDRSDQLIVLVA